MLRPEAAWLCARLAEFVPDGLSPMLNIGSSTAAFRHKRQPWMETLVFAPLHARGVVVKHVDVKTADGVDLVGDLMDPAFVSTLRSYGFRSVLCSNVLEHVTDRTSLCTRLEALLRPGGLLIVTVPRRFPYHPDPIDTGFRPTVPELEAMFPGMDVIAAEEVDCGSLLESLPHGWWELGARVAWVFLPFLRVRGWIGNVHRLLHSGDRYAATCLVLRKREEAE